MKVGKDIIIPFENEKMELQCSYDERGHLLGQGKIIDVFGDLLCEGVFGIAYDIENANRTEGIRKTASILKNGSFYFEGQSYAISNFDGENGYGAIIEAFNALGFNCFDVKVGHFLNGELDGFGVYIDNVATIEKGEFLGGKLIKGIKSSTRGGRTECYEEYEFFDHEKHIAKGKVEYRGKGEILEGEFTFNGFSPMITKGSLKSTRCDDFWEGEFYHTSQHWVFVNGKGKWNGFEGEVIDKKPINAQGTLHDERSVHEEVCFIGKWANGIFDGEWRGKEKYLKNCPKCGEEIDYWDHGTCPACGQQSPKFYHCKKYVKGEIVSEYDVEE